MKKSLSISLLTIGFLFYEAATYLVFSIGNKSFSFQKWSSDAGVGFGFVAMIGVIVYTIFYAGIVSNNIKIKP